VINIKYYWQHLHTKQNSQPQKEHHFAQHFGHHHLEPQLEHHFAQYFAHFDLHFDHHLEPQFDHHLEPSLIIVRIIIWSLNLIIVRIIIWIIGKIMRLFSIIFIIQCN
jgi:hypothetical protein